MARFFAPLIVIIPLAAKLALCFPAYGSLAGLSDEEIDRIIPTLRHRDAELPPGPLKDTSISTELVNGKSHPWQPLRNGEMEIYVDHVLDLTCSHLTGYVYLLAFMTEVFTVLFISGFLGMILQPPLRSLMRLKRVSHYCW
jgi:hypothetical protein